MKDIRVINALRLVQAADEFRARLSGELNAVHGLSVNELFLLMHLDKAALHKLSRVALAKRMHVSASTITRTVAPMEKIGLLTREADNRDARKALVVLTEAGQIKLSEARKTFAKQAEYAFQDRWDKPELDSLAQLLHRLVVGTLANLT